MSLRSTWIVRDSLLPLLNDLSPNMLLPDSNMFISTVEKDNIYYYEAYRKSIGGNLIMKKWGLWTNGNLLFLQANKWARRRNLSGVTLRISAIDVRIIRTYFIQ